MKRQCLVVAAAALLTGCSPALPVAHFATTDPAFDPVRFWTGHTHSWGVLENRDGAPTAVVTTDCTGEPEGADGLHMVQHLTIEGEPDQMRDWHMRRVGPHAFEATANDMVGTARGTASGRVFHWSWVLATRPGDSLRDVTMDQWMYLEDDGAMVNRTTITKLGITLAQVTEQFARPTP
jgi:hypothetical protein